MNGNAVLLMLAVMALAACAEEPPPRTVTEFVENPILLEAAMVRCSQDRNSTRYDAECINAREAVKRIEAKEEAARRAEREAQSEAKRRALRRTQEAAAAARRRAAEAEQRRKEAEYLAQFGVPMSAETAAPEEPLSGNTPLAVIPESDDATSYDAVVTEQPPVAADANAPLAETEANPSDLESIRDELKRRNEDEQN